MRSLFTTDADGRIRPFHKSVTDWLVRRGMAHEADVADLAPAGGGLSTGMKVESKSPATPLASTATALTATAGGFSRKRTHAGAALVEAHAVRQVLDELVDGLRVEGARTLLLAASLAM